MRFRLDPTPAQHEQLLGHCAAARFVWNLGLEQRAMWRPGRGPTPGMAEQMRQLTEARADSDWLRAQPQVVQQQALRDLEQAFRNFFARSHRYPTWRRQGQSEGFRVVGASVQYERVNRRWSRVLIPKVGWVKFRADRALPTGDAAPKSYRVTQDRRGRWHIAFALIPAPIPAPRNGEIVGVDRGVIVSAALSTGELLHAPKPGKKEAERLLRLQRRLARAKRGSNRRKGLVRKIATIKARDADRRKDWVEKTSTDLATRFDLIGLERLNTKAMTKSAKGTINVPGSNVAQKAGLNREILKNGWGLLQTRLQHKAPGRVVFVPAAWTSQTCNACGHVDGDSRENQATFLCTACGHAAHADINASKNIRDLAVATLLPAQSGVQRQDVPSQQDAEPSRNSRALKRQPASPHQTAPAV